MFNWGQGVRFIFHFLNILLFLNIKSFMFSRVGHSELSGAFISRGPALSRYSLSSSYRYFLASCSQIKIGMTQFLQI